MLNVELLVSCILIVLGSLLYLFFWNRALGYLLGLLLRLTLWKHSKSATWVDFGSIHLSLLGGAIMLRDIRYVSSNQTFHIVKCQVTWRYWIRKPAEDLEIKGPEEGERVTGEDTKQPQCRIHISAEGFEWFMHNRTNAYENILSQLIAVDSPFLKAKSHDSNAYSLASTRGGQQTVSARSTAANAISRVCSSIRFPQFLRNIFAEIRSHLPKLDPKNLFPLSFDASKGAITCGNHTTPSLLMARFTRASGSFGIVQSRSSLDLHKQLLRIEFEGVAINCVENKDYWNTSQKIGNDVHTSLSQVYLNILSFKNFRKAWMRSRKNFAYFKSRGQKYVNPERGQRKRGKKDHEEESHVGADFSKLEYALDRKLLEAPRLSLTYYADVAGLVPDETLEYKTSKGLEFIDIGNGDLPPEWGLDLVSYGATIHYGPWADRQRVRLQHIFFPPAFQNVTSTKPLLPGDQRLSTCLKLFFEFRGTTTLRIPFKEASKDWQWDGLVDVSRDRRQREAASLQIRVGNNSSLKYLVPMVATNEGYVPELDLFMDDISVTSSLNDIRLLETPTLSLNARLPSPLTWDSERSWNFNIDLERPIFYLIRDHINMFTDLGKDWSSGPPSDFNTFVPVIYGLHINCESYEINFYGNDQNIIDRPLDRRDNVLFTFLGPTLKSNITIPANKFRPFSTTIPVSIIAPNVELRLNLPRWNTHTLSSPKQLERIGTLSNFRFDASYIYYSTVRDDCIDQLKIMMKLGSPAVKLFGWVVRHVMVLRENYFGSFTQYSTTREYLSKRQNGAVGDPLELKYRPGKFTLSLILENGLLALPAGLPGYEKRFAKNGDEEGSPDIGSCAVCTVPGLQLHLRLHDYFMEMSLDCDPIHTSFEQSCTDRDFLSHLFRPSRKQLSVSGFGITSNRLFGPPPRAIAYVCMWEIVVGKVKGTLSTSEAEILMLVGKSFMRGFSDPFNAPAAEFIATSDRDATFLKIAVNFIDGSLLTDSNAIRLFLPEGLAFFFNNLAGTYYRKVTSVNVPKIELQMLALPSRSSQWIEAAACRASLSLDLYKSPTGWRQDAEIQKRFVEAQDSVTHRFVDKFAKNKATAYTSKGAFVYLQNVSAPRVRPTQHTIKRRRDTGHQRYRSVDSHGGRSESEEDRHIIDVDRDKRLVNSRPTSVGKGFDNADNSTSLDESDETGSEITASTWSGHERSEYIADTTSLYGRLCRRFKLRKLSVLDPCLFEFQVSKEAREFNIKNAPRERERTPITLHSEPTVFSSMKLKGTKPDDIDTTHLRLKIAEVWILVTPLALAIFSELSSNISTIPSSPELYLDGLMFDTAPQPKPSLLLFDFSMHSLHARFLQDLMDVNDLRKLSPSFPTPEMMSPEDKAISITELIIKDISTVISIPSGFESPAYVPLGKGSVCGVCFNIATAFVPSAKTPHSLSATSALRLNLDGLSVLRTKSKTELCITTSTLNLHANASEITFASVREYAKHLNLAVGIIEKHKLDSWQRQSSFLSLVLDYSLKNPATDLLSAVQPSFLVQKGKPERMRQDKIWKLLFYLRHSLGDASPNTRLSFTPPDMRMVDTDTIPKSYQVPWADEQIPTSDIPGFKKVLTDKPPVRRADNANVQTCQQVSFRSTSLKVIFEASSPLSNSSLTASEIDLRADILSRRVVIAPLVSPFPLTSRRPSGSDLDSHGSLNVLLCLSIGSVQITIFPHIISFIQNAIHGVRYFTSHDTSMDAGKPRDTTNTSFLRRIEGLLICDARILIHRSLIEAAAENIIFEVTSQEVSSSSLVRLSKTSAKPDATADFSVNHTVGFDEFAIRARARAFSESKYKENDLLAGFVISGGLLCSLLQSNEPQGSMARNTMHINTMELSVPRSAIRLYHFIEQWKEDYFMGINTMVQSLFTEIKQTPKRQTASQPWISALEINSNINSIEIGLQVMHGTWLSWSAHDIVTFAQNSFKRQIPTHSYGLQVGSQSLRITSSMITGRRKSSMDAIPKISLDLPILRVSGSFNTEQTNLLIFVGLLQVNIKPSHWDSLLSVQQKFGQDFNDLLLIVGQRGDKRSAAPEKSKSVPFTMTSKFEGFKVGLEGPSYTQFLECVDMDATISNKESRQWQVKLSDFALYLAPNSAYGHGPDKGQYPLLVSIDLRLTDHRPPPSEFTSESSLMLEVTKFHAVLQANRISEIGDFIDYLQSEMLLRREQRAIELSEFKGKARKVMQTFNMSPQSKSSINNGNPWGNRMVIFSISNFGVAFPLDSTSERSQQDTATRAFLFSIISLGFQSHRGETSQVLMRGFSFQFVSRFNPSNPEDFSSDTHHTLNKLLYPEMMARVRMQTSSLTRSIIVSASISGFILDLDPSVTTFVFSLIDIYRQGRQRVERLAASLPRNTTDIELSNPSPDTNEAHENQRPGLTSTLRATLRFLSGKIRMHPTPMKDAPILSRLSPWLGQTYQIPDPDAELFQLPEVSVLCDYRVETSKSGSEARFPVLMFKATIHSSSNILRPSLLPFVTEITRNIEDRMKKMSPDIPLIQQRADRLRPVSTAEEPPLSATKHRYMTTASLQIIFSLRIDQSHLELTCKPDVNVVAGLHWESGGFVVNISPGARGASVSASIGGLTASLKHGFLSDNSAHLNAHNLNFSVNFAKTELPFGQFINAISVVVDTEIRGSIRFFRLQDILCFKAVWLDHIPVLSNDLLPVSASSNENEVPVPDAHPPKQGFDTSILINIRRVALDADLGQSISMVALELQSMRARTHLTEGVSDLSVSIDRVDVEARGNLSGHLRVPDFLFQTVRRREGSFDRQGLSRMLELHLTSGILDIQLQSDWLWLLQYRAEPLKASIYDDWPAENLASPVRNRQLKLYFTVSGTKVVAMMTIMAIPKLLMYAGKFMANLDAQREGASRESSAFRSTRLSKPDNALSEVANAMLQSARVKLKETESLSYAIAQHMKLKLDELVFVLLPRSQGDTESARFVGRDVMAQLGREVQPDGHPIHRDLRLSLSHMSISQLLKQGFDPSLPGQEFDVFTTIGRTFGGVENIIFSLPAIDMNMITDEDIQDDLRILPYDFESTFIRHEGQKGIENIYISLNISLYSWLTILRKTFARELKRAQEGPDWKTGNVSPSATFAPRMASTDVGREKNIWHGNRASSPRRSISLERTPAISRSRSMGSRAMVTAPSIGLSESTESLMTGSPVLPDSHNQPVNTFGSLDATPERRISVDVPLRKSAELVYKVRNRKIERLTVRQLGEATPDVMHPFFTKRAGFNLEESLPQYVHEYATLPIEEIMKALVKIYSKQLRIGQG